MKYRIERACRMCFVHPAREHHIQVRLAPWDDDSQSLLRVTLKVDPEVEPVACLDAFGNLSHHFAVLGAHRRIDFSIVAEVETKRENPFDFQPVPPEREWAWIADSLRQAPRLWDFVLHRGPLTPELAEVLGEGEIPGLRQGVPLLRQVQDAFGWMRGIAAFDPAEEASVASLESLFDRKRGTAADLAHLLIALMRHWRLPARFVSGYLDAAYFEPDDEDPPDSPARPQRPHHWVEVLIPGGGWLGFDPAFGLVADATYIRVAIGRDANDIEPIRQSCRGECVQAELNLALMVSRLPV